jgi:hypothetical protein
MTAYLVSYDLHNQRTYPPVWSALSSIGGVRLLESLWLVSTTLSSTQLRDRVVAAADRDDSIAVIPIAPGTIWATTRAKDEGVAFLRHYVAA